jgi:hypothetical protein
MVFVARILQKQRTNPIDFDRPVIATESYSRLILPKRFDKSDKWDYIDPYYRCEFPIGKNLCQRRNK